MKNSKAPQPKAPEPKAPEVTDPFNKLPLKSKKFIAYLLAEAGWKILIGYVIWEYKTEINHYAFMVLVSMIVTSGFIQIGYILGQTALDKYTAVAQSALKDKKEGEGQ